MKHQRKNLGQDVHRISLYQESCIWTQITRNCSGSYLTAKKLSVANLKSHALIAT